MSPNINLLNIVLILVSNPVTSIVSYLLSQTWKLGNSLARMRILVKWMYTIFKHEKSIRLLRAIYLADYLAQQNGGNQAVCNVLLSRTKKLHFSTKKSLLGRVLSLDKRGQSSSKISPFYQSIHSDKMEVSKFQTKFCFLKHGKCVLLLLPCSELLICAGHRSTAVRLSFHGFTHVHI